jgi:glycosyltransferase involved in cell wall biosynthesis
MADCSAEVAVVVLTLNEEANIRYCLESVDGWADSIYIIDSASTDDTVEIAREYTENVLFVEDELAGSYDYANIRNWAMSNAHIENDWLLFLDADERMTGPLKREISEALSSNPTENGFYIYRRFIFLGKWLKYGRNYACELRLSRASKTEYIERGDVEYAKVEGSVGTLEHDMIHNDKKPFSDWVWKHDRTAERAAEQYLRRERGEVDSLYEKDSNDTTIEGEGRHWLIENVWERLPLLVRPFVMFGYVYVFQQGFRDGLRGLVYYLHHEFWYHLLIATKVMEKRRE